jgi:hypothetical protein
MIPHMLKFEPQKTSSYAEKSVFFLLRVLIKARIHDPYRPCILELSHCRIIEIAVKFI